jgi:transcriptional regulator of heat shock response
MNSIAGPSKSGSGRSGKVEEVESRTSRYWQRGTTRASTTTLPAKAGSHGSQLLGKRQLVVLFKFSTFQVFHFFFIMLDPNSLQLMIKSGISHYQHN